MKLSSMRKGTLNGHIHRSSHSCWTSLPILVKAFVGLMVVQLILVFAACTLFRGWFLAPSHHTRQRTAGKKSKRSIFREHNLPGVDRHSISSINKRNFTRPIDDYTTRKHIKFKSTSNDPDPSDLPILVVGGSDGSGTRAFVDMLGRLGIPMLIDDSGTGDVHAQCMFDGDGWPALVRAVLKTTQRANYTWEDLPLVQQTMIQSAIDRFVEHYGQRGKGLRDHGIKQGFPIAEKVIYGFKAPVSMILLPVLRHVLGRIKFLHIVRDGRDVALSKNKSPVQKFYHIFYPDASERQAEFEKIEGDFVFEEAMAIQLWNDWNTQVLEWERKNSDGETFDYLVMRTEDLMDPSTRLVSLRQLADFVGSQKSETELCRLSKQEIKDMGQSGVRSPESYEHRGPTTWELISTWMKSFWYKASVRVGARPAFGEQATVVMPNTMGQTRRHGGEKVMDVKEIQTDVQGVLREAQSFDSSLQKRRPHLFRKIKQQRDRAQELVRQQRVVDGRNLARSVSNTIIGDAALPEQQERDSHGDAARIPWRNTSKSAVVVDHVKYETMLERVREAELDSRKDYLRVGRRFDGSKPHEDQPESPEKVMKRYGKWMKAMDGRPELARVLHKEGALGLRLFGYEPRSPFSDFRQETESVNHEGC